jgi:hypothetical protein
MKSTALTLAASAVMALFTTNVSATALLGVYDGNDCAGTFGQPFASCVAPAFDGYDRSPVIAKYDLDDDAWEFNTALFPGIDETAWDIDINAGNDGRTGSFTYTLLNANYPGITSFVVKAGNGFAWFGPVGAPAGNVQTGSWDISTITALGGFSHITFYDNGDSYQMPEPTALALLGVALVGAGVARRKRRS